MYSIRPYSFLIAAKSGYNTRYFTFARIFSEFTSFRISVRVLCLSINCLTFDGKSVTWLAYQFLPPIASHTYVCTVPAVRAVPYITICMHTSQCVSLVLLAFRVPRSDHHYSHGQSSPVGVLPDYNVCQGLCKLPHGSAWVLPHTQFTRVRTHRTCLRELRCIWRSHACRYCASRDFMLEQYKH